jgi:hypothetical protein
MYRRDFLKLSGLLSAALLMQIHPVQEIASLSLAPVEVVSGGNLYRGTPDGRIYVSANAGKDWQMHTNFGSHVSIFSLTTDHRNQVRAQLGCADHSFVLALSPDQRIWKTV